MLSLAAAGATQEPSGAFIAALWVLTVVFLAFPVGCAIAALRLKQISRSLPEGQERMGKSGQAGCLMIFAFPALIFGLFLLSWVTSID